MPAIVAAMGDVQIPMSVPLDSDGFMRRECPTCERELKWRPTPEGEEGLPVPEGGYFCPYCAVQAPTGSWWTKAQLDAVQAKIHNEVVKPMLDDFGKSLERASSPHVRITSKSTDRAEEPQLSESDDMQRVDFSCHPEEPVKVLDGWDQPVHCMICGQPASASQS
jgi:hypothetical protein